MPRRSNWFQFHTDFLELEGSKRQSLAIGHTRCIGSIDVPRMRVPFDDLGRKLWLHGIRYQEMRHVGGQVVSCQPIRELFSWAADKLNMCMHQARCVLHS
jgi:hypothetical protein